MVEAQEIAIIQEMERASIHKNISRSVNPTGDNELTTERTKTTAKWCSHHRTTLHDNSECMWRRKNKKNTLIKTIRNYFKISFHNADNLVEAEVKLNNVPCCAVIDTESMDNFLAERIAKIGNVPIIPIQSQFKVKGIGNSFTLINSCITTGLITH